MCPFVFFRLLGQAFEEQHHHARMAAGTAHAVAFGGAVQAAVFGSAVVGNAAVGQRPFLADSVPPHQLT